MKNKQRLNRVRHGFLLTFFDQKEEYQAKEVNGYVLVKQWNAGTNSWEVATWEKSNWEKTKERQTQFGENKRRLEYLTQ